MWEYIKSDLFRYNGKKGFKAFLKMYITNPLFRFLVWYRIANHYSNKKNRIISIVIGIRYNIISRKVRIEIPKRTKIGYGIKIWHGHGIVINENAIIGDNVMLTHNVTFATERGGSPIIGNCVRFAPGAVIVGGVKIGDNSVVGANTMVNKDIPPKSISMGVPNKILDIEFRENVERYFWRPEENT
ncbi:MAG: hypothetical protein JXB49_31105 [Bacteroidales bacterium]|nr:hypothetical protein [Bacteroidales bacterium]MBN2820711.1 hypothetical protein [Bacteroidales bacterium]